MNPNTKKPKQSPNQTATTEIDQETRTPDIKEILSLKSGILNHSRRTAPRILDNSLARRRPHSTSLRRAVEGKIANTLIKLRGSGLAESTLKYTLWLLS